MTPTSVCWSKIQRGLVEPVLRGRCERDVFQPVEKWSGIITLSTGRMLIGVQRGGRRNNVGWSYFDRVWSAIQRK